MQYAYLIIARERMIRSLNSHLILWYAILGPQILTNIFKLNWTCSFLRISCQMWIGAVPWIVHITSYSLFTWNLGCYIRMIFMDLLQSHRACKGIHMKQIVMSNNHFIVIINLPGQGICTTSTEKRLPFISYLVDSS